MNKQNILTNWATPIHTFIFNYSFGPPSIRVAWVGDFRCGIIEPYKYYCINKDGVLYLLLTYTRIPIINFKKHDYNAIKFSANTNSRYSLPNKSIEVENKTKANYVKINWNFNDIDKIIAKKSYKINLYKKNDYPQNIPLLELLNQTLKLGIFQLDPLAH
ncbi:virion protein [Glossina pallidipes salivary gland hypertrophy virus]|uniref:Virion protein n=2 Tax=Glossina hytrovirus (isolate Glossina pallidipes/Ethiopia/Seibersdorf/-) TaxID=379529 RepID=A0A0Y0G7F7_GHVS|nr:hypothetical protein SGHV082 [Glossina pallidipes salivary gland hypertrophy virus]ABQ08855.1 hypothetical protein SGHV082 [Glossina pallidipes salivary gland hypertrophy virus]AMB48694.1 virion protein [Glossina pallidipes salivary gland hypertrophy virus]